MRVEWFNASSSLVAFCRCSKTNQAKVSDFIHVVIRLFSILHAVALADIEDSVSERFEDIEAFRFELIDIDGLDLNTLRALKNSDCRVELVFQWIQQVIVEGIETQVLTVAPPILSRAWQDLIQGMSAFQEAIKISTIPFPFPYAQTCDCILILHWMVTPFIFSTWVSTWWWAAIFTFLQVFVLWALNFIALEIEHPFGMDANDLDGKHMQAEMNRHLKLLVDPVVTQLPTLSRDAVRNLNENPPRSLHDVWVKLAEEGEEHVCPARRYFSSLDLHTITGKRRISSTLANSITNVDEFLASHILDVRPRSPEGSPLQHVQPDSTREVCVVSPLDQLAPPRKLEARSEAASSFTLTLSHQGPLPVLQEEPPRQPEG